MIMPWNRDDNGRSFQTRTSKLSPTDRDKIKQRYAEGESANTLALEYGVSARTIRYYADPR